ncbi:MAG: dihydropteroate synthase-like protein [Ignisphaera sp.]
MARILIVTSRLAEPIVREAVALSNTKHHVEILVAPVDVAAFLSTDYIAKLLLSRGIKKGDYDYILVPGLARGSGRVVEEAIGIKTFKGCTIAYDLTELLKLEDLSTLSEDSPADDILQKLFIDRNKRLLIEVEEKARLNGFSVGNLHIPLIPPPIRVASEVAFAHRVDESLLYKRVMYLIESGADIVSLGFEALEPHPDDVYRIVRFLKREFDVAIAIDTPIPSEISRGVEAGCDMVINIDLTNIDRVVDYVKDVAVVVIPRDPSTGSIPFSSSQRVELLIKTIDYVKSLGVEKILADAVLDPPGSTFNSMIAYHSFKMLHPEIPMFMGIGNVAELVDIDSVGVNALLVLLAQEIGVSVVLTSECSTKTYGSTRETKIATQMAALAKTMKTMPKNLGISLLILKDKKRVKVPLDSDAEIVTATEKDTEYALDPLGIFKIDVNHDEGFIEALYIGRKGKILIRGKTAKAIRDEILSRELVSSLSHAIYLGIELAKAEEALRTGKNYIQELPLFTLPKPIELRNSGIETLAKK